MSLSILPMHAKCKSRLLLLITHIPDWQNWSPILLSFSENDKILVQAPYNVHWVHNTQIYPLLLRLEPSSECVVLSITYVCLGYHSSARSRDVYWEPYWLGTYKLILYSWNDSHSCISRHLRLTPIESIIFVI